MSEQKTSNNLEVIHTNIDTKELSTSNCPVDPSAAHSRTLSIPIDSDHQMSKPKTVRPSSVTYEPFLMTKNEATFTKGNKNSYRWGTSFHKRRHSGGNIPKSHIDAEPFSQQYLDSSSHRLRAQLGPYVEEMQKLISRTDDPTSRVRSASHPRSPSPHILSHGECAYTRPHDIEIVTTL